MTLAASIAALMVVLGAATASAQDDWEVVQRPASQTASKNAAVPAPPASPDSANGTPKSVCGEEALPAAPAIKTLVGQINDLWGSNFEVYQTVAFEPPHASSGGCIFYNSTAMGVLMTNRLDVNDPNAVAPMMWAIFAHELGHQYHHDSEASRAEVPIEIKELEADRFAGYTLERLKIRATDLTPFWTMTGDEFGGHSGRGGKHGSSEQRVAAFKQGWHLAEWNRAENSQSVEDALNDSVAPDSPDGAPK